MQIVYKTLRGIEHAFAENYWNHLMSHFLVKSVEEGGSEVEVLPFWGFYYLSHSVSDIISMMDEGGEEFITLLLNRGLPIEFLSNPEHAIPMRKTKTTWEKIKSLFKY